MGNRHSGADPAADADGRQPMARNARHGWLKVQSVYFALAAINIVAIAGSIAVGLFVLSTFKSGAGRNLGFDRQTAYLIGFSSALGEAQSIVVSGVLQQGPRSFASDFHTRIDNFNRDLAAFKASVQAIETDAMRDRLTILASKVEKGFPSLVDHGRAALAAAQAGDRDLAYREFAQMQARYSTMQMLVRDINQKINLLRKAATENDVARMVGIQRIEYLIAGIMALIVCALIAYGHFAGRLLRRKYSEVEESNAKLSAASAESTAYAHQVERVNGDIAALNRQLEENYSKLQEAQDELLRRARMSQLGQLTATVAHELRNPLGAVRTSAFLLERKLKDKGLNVEDQIARINSGVRRCDGIISQLLDFARNRSLQREELVLDDWLADQVNMIAENLPPPVAIECHLGTSGAKLSFDPQQMHRALLNLMNNASEAMVGKAEEPGKAAIANPRIIISSAQTSRGIEIAVADNGPGIPEDIINRVLEPLFTTKSFGTGLGLPAVQKVLELHGGGLDVESRPGGGACFVAWWPGGGELQEVA